MSEPWITGVAGVILAGGASRRFGANKALARCHGRPLISHVAGLLEALFEERLLVTNTPADYAFLGWPHVADRFPGAGPLAGIHAALAGLTAERAFVTGCDMPFLNGKLIGYLCHLPGDWDVVLPWLPDGPEPLHAVYHRRLVPRIEASLAGGQRKITAFLAGLAVRRVEAEEILAVVPDLAVFHNVNRPRDLPTSSPE